MAGRQRSDDSARGCFEEKEEDEIRMMKQIRKPWRTTPEDDFRKIFRKKMNFGDPRIWLKQLITLTP